MRVDFHRDFSKDLRKLSAKLQEQLEQRIVLFQSQPTLPALHNHPLKGRYLGYRSINVSGDVRAIYREVTKNHVEFFRVGTHSQLY